MKRELFKGFFYVLNITNFGLFVHLRTKKVIHFNLEQWKKSMKNRIVPKRVVPLFPKQSGRADEFETKKDTLVNVRYLQYR